MLMLLLPMLKLSFLLPLLGLIVKLGFVAAISSAEAGSNRILVFLVASFCCFKNVEVADAFSYSGVQPFSFIPLKHFTQPIRINHGHSQGLVFSSSSLPVYSGMDNVEDEVESQTVSSLLELDPQEASLVETIWSTAFSSSDVSGEDSIMERTLHSFLPQMSPSLILKLRTHTFASNQNNTKIQAIQRALGKILDEKLQQSKDLLHTFLTSGEIRKLDGLIGKAARENRLDSSFFAVLNTNIQDAYMGQSQGIANNNATSASNERLQILRHIDTRCQEEVEKHVAPPGLALLHKLLRTDITAIRTNILRHYLGPQAVTVTTPDGQVIPLKSSSPSKALVTSTEFRTAIENAVAQIRQMEKVGGTDKSTAATMVESIRQAAKEARSILEESYGPDGAQLRDFEMGLMPVFRPDRGSIYSPE